MTKAEIATGLGISAAAITKLVRRGMPLSSVAAAQDWRQANNKKGGRPRKVDRPERPSAPPPPPRTPPPPAFQEPPPPPTPDPVTESKESDPRDSVKMARLAEKAAWGRFVAAQKNPETSPDEFRRINAAYIAARQNRMKAEQDFRDWRRQEGITLFLSEAQDIASRPHQAVAQMLGVGPKQLAPRLHGQPVREIERTLAEWCDNVAGVIRQAI